VKGLNVTGVTTLNSSETFMTGGRSLMHKISHLVLLNFINYKLKIGKLLPRHPLVCYTITDGYVTSVSTGIY